MRTGHQFHRETFLLEGFLHSHAIKCQMYGPCHLPAQMGACWKGFRAVVRVRFSTSSRRSARLRVYPQKRCFGNSREETYCLVDFCPIQARHLHLISAGSSRNVRHL